MSDETSSAESAQQLGGLVLGQRFASFTEVNAAVAEWSARGHFDIRYEKSERDVNVVVCWIAECTFRIRAISKPKIGCIEVIVLNPKHTACAGLMPSKRRSVSTFSFLREAVPSAIKVDSTTKPKDIVKAINQKYNRFHIMQPTRSSGNSMAH
jgi:hypothetical protein